MEYLAGALAPRLPGYFLSVHQPWRDTFLPLVVLSPAGVKTVLLPDGELPGRAEPETGALRRAELTTAGMRWLVVDGYGCWEDVDGEVERLVGELAIR